MFKALASLALLLLVCTISNVPRLMANEAPRDVVADLAPSGKLRAAINFGNSVLAQRDPAGGPPRGVSGDLARELARRLGVALDTSPSTPPARSSRRSRRAPGMSPSWQSIQSVPPRLRSPARMS
jgi:ABC-type amino acid transport substrate-binding protein